MKKEEWDQIRKVALSADVLCDKIRRLGYLNCSQNDEKLSDDIRRIENAAQKVFMDLIRIISGLRDGVLNKQQRHEILVKFLKEKGMENLPIVDQQDVRTYERLETIDIEHINRAVVVFTDALNIYSGSVRDHDLYRLMQAYVTKPSCRAAINREVNAALNRSDIE